MIDLRANLLALAKDAGGPLLGMDTSCGQAGICTVGWQSDEIEELLLDAQSMPSESLIMALAEARNRADLDLTRLAGIVIGLGPGSYTGLRVGLATAKGLALAGGTPVFGVSSLALLALGAGPGLVAPVLDARVGEVFGALYQVDADGRVAAVVDDGAYAPTRFRELIEQRAHGSVRWVGDGVRACGAEPAARDQTAGAGRGSSALWLAAARIRSGAADDLVSLAPSYLRVSEAERDKRK